jgi:putative ABC transport system substrate-binding protein
MRRREFLRLVGGLAAWPIVGEAQPLAVPVIGFLNPGSPEPFARFAAAFHEGLNETGYFESRNVKVEYRWAEGRQERLRSLAADLAQRKVDLIAATGGSFVALAAMTATATIPILFIAGSDPVEIDSSPASIGRAAMPQG